MRRTGRIFVVLLWGAWISCILRSEAADYYSDGSAASVQALHDIASNGDRIILPAGTFTWSTSVTISKAITLQGNGIGRTIIRDAVQTPGFLFAREFSRWRRQSSDWNRISRWRQDDKHFCAKRRNQDFREQHKSQCDPYRSLQVLPFERQRRNGDGHRVGVRSLRVLFQGESLTCSPTRAATMAARGAINRGLLRADLVGRTSCSWRIAY